MDSCDWGLESTLWKCRTNHVKTETHTVVPLEGNQMVFPIIIDGKTKRYI